MHRITAILTLFAFLSATAFAPVANAGIITTEAYVQQAESDAKRAAVSEMLQRDEVRRQMLGMGVEPETIEDRLAGLSDAEVAQLAEQMEQLPAGAGVVETLLIVVLVFVILDIAGVTNVFPFIQPAK